MDKLLSENRIFKQRTVDIGVVSADDALEHGLLGSDAARLGRRLGPAEGATLCRRTSSMDFDIPVGTHGDCWDRYLVRIAGDAASR